MSKILQGILQFVTQKPVHSPVNMYDKMANFHVVQTTNEVGEKRYIEIPKSSSNLRREKLDFILKKSQSMLNNCLKIQKTNDDLSYDIVNLIDRVRQSLYRKGDIEEIVDDFRDIKKRAKSKGSMSSFDLTKWKD